MGKKIRFISALVLLVAVCSFVGFSNSGENSISPQAANLTVTVSGYPSCVGVNVYAQNEKSGLITQLSPTTGCDFQATVLPGDYRIWSCDGNMAGQTTVGIKSDETDVSVNLTVTAGECPDDD